MKLELIRQLPTDDDRIELLFKIDKELYDVYRSETGDDDFNQDSFDEWINELIKHAVEEEDWRDDDG
tara:strand:- start:905 stop:1105 length:201 start_codon:yes stop_codon:yes gene_type:complete